jgi:hypothetical protein
MKTHQVANTLKLLAAALEAGPNIELRDDILLGKPSVPPDTSTMALSLSALTDLARIDKRQWLAFVKENSIPLNLRERDASRDILGKVLAYLEKNPAAQERLKQSARRKSGQTSPELMKAFALLLGESK